MIPLNSLYNQILESLGLHASTDGLLSRINEKGENELCMVGNKRLALALPSILNRSPWDTIVPFHPLSEGAMRQESVVQKKLRFMVKVRLQEVISFLWGSLVAISADKDNHKHLTPAQISFLKAIPDADARMVKAVAGLLREIDVVGDKTILNIYPKRTNKIGAKSFTRTAIVTFPILKDLYRLEPDVNVDSAKQEYSVYGAGMRKKDKESLKNLFDALLPHAEDSDSYSGGSNSVVAPSFDALMRAYYNVAYRLNEITELFGNQLGDKAIHIDLGWIKKMDTLEAFRDMLPTPLPGNDGEPIKGMQEENGPTIDLKPAAPRQTQQPQQQPVRQAIQAVEPLPPGGHVLRPEVQAVAQNNVANWEQTMLQYQYEQSLRAQGGWIAPGMYTPPAVNAPPPPFARFTGSDAPQQQQPGNTLLSPQTMMPGVTNASWGGGI